MIEQLREHCNISVLEKCYNNGRELPVGIVDENVPSASCFFHLLNSTSKTTHLFILDGNAVAFIPPTEDQLLLASGHTGALVAHCECKSLPEHMDWFRIFNAYQYTLGTVTKVTFNWAR